MAETSGPFDASDLTEADWELMLQYLVDGVLDVPGGTKLKASASGAVTRGVDITAGTGLIAGHWYKNSATLTVSSSANAAGASRIDRGVLRLDRSGNAVTVEVLTGTAGSPSPPALTDNTSVTEKPLWRWTVAPGAAGVTSLVDERQFLGALPRAFTSTNRPLNPRIATIGPETDTGRWLGWNGSQFDLLYEDTDWTSLSMNGPDGGAWTANNVCRVRKINNVVHLRIAVKRWNNSSLPTSDDGSQPINLPSAYHPAGGVDEYGSGFHSRSPVELRIQASDGGVRIYPLIDPIPAGKTVFAVATWMVG